MHLNLLDRSIAGDVRAFSEEGGQKMSRTVAMRKKV
jgi:hypothetical protein